MTTQPPIGPAPHCPEDSSSSSSQAPNIPGTPEIRFGDVSSICSLGMRPLLMTGFLRQVMIQHFADRTNIEEPSLCDLLWTANTITNNILIESITKFEPDQVEKRPAIIIKRNAWKVNRLGINDMMMGTYNLDGHDRYMTTMQGSHTLFCIAGEGGEAELLGAEVYRELLEFGPVIRQNLSMLKFMVSEVGPVSEIEEATENYVVPVTVVYAHEESWILRAHAPRMKRIELSASTLGAC